MRKSRLVGKIFGIALASAVIGVIAHFAHLIARGICTMS